MTEEKILIEKCLQNNPKAQKIVFDYYSEKMLRLCYRYLGNRTDAEEAMLSGFYKVFTHIAAFEYRETGSFERWMKTIMINDCLMCLRAKSDVRFVEIENIKNYGDTDEIAEEIDMQKIFTLISELPDGYRTVLNLFLIDGYTHEEISGKLNISVNTSKSQLHKAKQYLKSQISKSKIYER